MSIPEIVTVDDIEYRLRKSLRRLVEELGEERVRFRLRSAEAPDVLKERLLRELSTIIRTRSPSA